MDPTRVLPIVVILLLVAVEWGGWSLLGFISGGEGLADWQRASFRAGHAHAGVLNALALVYLLYLPRAEFADGIEWAVGAVLILGVLAQSGGFFVHMTQGQEGQPSIGTKITQVGAVLLGVALLTLAVGLIRTA